MRWFPGVSYRTGLDSNADANLGAHIHTCRANTRTDIDPCTCADLDSCANINPSTNTHTG